jgi:CheY-like chemotaxis protein
MSLDFLAQYQLEIIAALLVIVLIVIYLLSTKRPKKKETLLEIQPAIPDEYETESDTLKKIQKDVYAEEEKEEIKEQEKKATPKTPDIEKKQEQDIVNPEILEQIETQPASSNKFTKQAVPPHGKIKKEDFSRFKGKRILLAEDNIINQKVILGLLSGSGIDVVVANDGQEVLNILENDIDFMLILMDAHMPNIDGFEATRIIRKNPKYDHIVIIALSGDTASDDIKKMKDAGMSETLEKPLRMDALYDIMYAYNTAPHTATPKSDSSFIAILDTKKGLSICGNDDNFYKEMLREFLQDYKHSDESLSILIKEKKVGEADNLLLDIIGVSANLGAEKLHNTAITFKELLKTPNADVTTSLASYKDALQQTIKSVQEYL